uniref:Putative lipocalin-3 1 n=1 Tax=Amblyomma tuberculatum TaxID=48802 RepID=A0A6M2E4L6_9ACAR
MDTRVFFLFLFGLVTKVTQSNMIPPLNVINVPVMTDRADIQKFLNTAEPIWTYITSDESNLTCEVDMIHNITSKDTYFHRYFYVGQKTVQNDTLRQIRRLARKRCE